METNAGLLIMKSWYQERKPKFKVGDIVEDTKNAGQSLSYPVYIIKESVTLMDGIIESGYSYEVAPINSPDESIIINEENLSYQYHDIEWEKYFTESVGNGLPAWRGELYNFFMFFDNHEDISLEPDAAVNVHEMEEFKDHTIPPIRMWHILRSHSIFARVNDVVKSMENKKIISEALNINTLDVRLFAADFNRKIKLRNSNNTTYTKKLENQVIPKFTEDEKVFANLIDKSDASENGIKDHYPYYLTDLQIMDAIREAYGNARKISSKTINVSENPTDEDPDARFIGKRNYEGYSEKYDLAIQFIYNFDYNYIETAYPARMNNNIKKH